MTYLEIQTEVLALAHMTGDSAYTTLVKRWINMAYRKLYRYHNWKWWAGSSTIPTVSGTEGYTLATDCGRVLALSVRIGSNNLAPTDWESLDSLDPARTSRGQPTHFYEWNQQICFHPIPNGVWTVSYRYKKKLTALSGDTDVPVFPSEYHDILTWGALIVAQKELDDLQLSVDADREFRDILRDMIANEGVIAMPPLQSSIAWFNNY